MLIFISHPCLVNNLSSFNHPMFFYLFIGHVKVYGSVQTGNRIGQDETRIQEVNADCKKWAGAATKAKEEVTEHNKLIEELRTDALEKETRIDHLQKMNDELNAHLSKAKEDAVAEFKSSKVYTDTWIIIMQLVLRISEWMLSRTSLKLILAQSNLILLLQPVLLFRLALMTSMWRTMPALSHPKTTPMSMLPLLKDETFTLRARGGAT